MPFLYLEMSSYAFKKISKIRNCIYKCKKNPQQIFQEVNVIFHCVYFTFNKIKSTKPSRKTFEQPCENNFCRGHKSFALYFSDASGHLYFPSDFKWSKYSNNKTFNLFPLNFNFPLIIQTFSTKDVKLEG